VFQRRKFFQGRSIRGEGIGDVSWFDATGKDITDEEWTGSLPCLGMRLAGDLIGETDERGEPIVGDTLLLLVNSTREDVPFALPATNPDHFWERLFDTSDDTLGPGIDAGRPYLLTGLSCAAFRTVSRDQEALGMTPLQAAKIRRDVRRAGPPLLPGTR
jgi:isoamylase